MTVTNFDHPEDADYVRWQDNGNSIEKRYPRTVHAIELHSHTGVVVVEPYDGHPDNAVIYNSDGTKRATLANPCAKDGAICFMYPYYVGAELTLMIAFKGLQFACVVDEAGTVLRTYETR